MQQAPKMYFQNHSIFVRFAIVCIITTILADLKEPRQTANKADVIAEHSLITEINTDNLLHALAIPQCLIIDIRSKEEYDKGHIRSAYSCPKGVCPESAIRYAPECTNIVICGSGVDLVEIHSIAKELLLKYNKTIFIYSKGWKRLSELTSALECYENIQK